MTLQVNKQAVAQAFGRAAAHYEQHAQLQRQSGEALLALAPAIGPQLLDAGCGTGWFSRYWRDRGRRLRAGSVTGDAAGGTRTALGARLFTGRYRPVTAGG